MDVKDQIRAILEKVGVDEFLDTLREIAEDDGNEETLAINFEVIAREIREELDDDKPLIIVV